MAEFRDFVDLVKMIAGSTGVHVTWDNMKRNYSRVVDTSVLNKGLGESLNKLGRAITAHNEFTRAMKKKYPDEIKTSMSSRSIARATGVPQTVSTYRVPAELPDKVKAQLEKLEVVVTERAQASTKIVEGYLTLAKAKMANPADKLTKPTGPSSPHNQALVWQDIVTDLGDIRAKIYLAIPPSRRR